MNLVINASEAIGGAEGTITVCTGVVELGSEALATALHPPAAAPGPNVCVRGARPGLRDWMPPRRRRSSTPSSRPKFTGGGSASPPRARRRARPPRRAPPSRARPDRGRPSASTSRPPARPRASSRPAAADAPARGASREERTGLWTTRRTCARDAPHAPSARCSVAPIGGRRPQGVDVFRAHSRPESTRLIVPNLTCRASRRPRVSARSAHSAPMPAHLDDGYSDEKADRRLAGGRARGLLRKPFSGPPGEGARRRGARAE